MQIIIAQNYEIGRWLMRDLGLNPLNCRIATEVIHIRGLEFDDYKVAGIPDDRLLQEAEIRKGRRSKQPTRRSE